MHPSSYALVLSTATNLYIVNNSNIYMSVFCLHARCLFFSTNMHMWSSMNYCDYSAQQSSCWVAFLLFFSLVFCWLSTDAPFSRYRIVLSMMEHYSITVSSHFSISPNGCNRKENWCTQSTPKELIIKSLYQQISMPVKRQNILFPHNSPNLNCQHYQRSFFISFSYKISCKCFTILFFINFIRNWISRRSPRIITDP